MKLTTIFLLICFSFATKAAQDAYEKVALGMEHACAITKSGNVKCWGLNDDGQATPPANLKDVIELKLGAHQTCALDKSHLLTCWGYNQNEYYFPKELENVRVKTAFSTKDNMTCAIRESDGVPFCWGRNAYGASVPTDVASLRDISVNAHGICGVTHNGVACWGAFHEGPPANLKKVDSVVIGDNSVICAVSSGDLSCWNSVYPEQLPSVDFGKVLSVEVGWYAGCAILQNHNVKCWGYNTNGVTSVPKDLGTVKSLSLNANSVCTVTTKGAIRCWGNSLIP